MADFEITTPDGRKFIVSGENAEGAYQALAQMLAQEGGQAPQATSGLGPDGMTSADRIAAAKAGTLAVSPENASRQAFIDTTAEQRLDDSPLNAFGSAFGKGVSYGFADEIAAGIGSVFEDRSYGEILSGLRGQDEYLAESFPKSTIGGEIAGAVASPISKALAPAKGANLAGNMVRGAGLGMAGGGLYGFGTGKGTTEDRIRSALIGGGTGMVLGFAIPLAAEVGKAGVRAVKDAWRNNQVSAQIARDLGVSPQTGRIVSDIVGADDPAAMRSALSMAGPDAMLADASPALGQTLDGAMRSPVPGSRLAFERIEERAAQSYDDLMGAVGRAKPVQETMEGIRTGTAAGRKAAYDTAYAVPIDYATDAGAKLLDEITPRLPPEAISYANRLMRLNGEKSGQIMATIADDGSVTFKNLPDVRQWDYIKQALNQLAESGDGAGALGGQTRMGAAHSGLANDVRDAVAELVPEYKTALGVASDAISERNAVKFGAEMLSPKTTTYDALKAIKEATPAEISAMKDGVRGQLDEVIGNVRAVPSDQNLDARQAIDAFKRLTSPNAQEKMEGLFGGEWAGIKEQLDRAGAALGLRARTSANSATAGRLFADRAIDEAVTPSALRSGNPVQAVKDFVAGLTGVSPAAVSRLKDEVKGEIADLLTRRGGNPQQAIEDVIRALIKNPVNPSAGQLTYDALMRGGFGAIPQAVETANKLLPR